MEFTPPTSYTRLRELELIPFDQEIGFGEGVENWIEPVSWYDTDPGRFDRLENIEDYMPPRDYVVLADSGGGCYWAWYLKSPIGAEYEICEIDIGMLNPHASSFEQFIFRSYLETLAWSSAEDFEGAASRFNDLRILEETLSSDDFAFLRAIETRSRSPSGYLISEAEVENILNDRFLSHQVSGYCGDYLENRKSEQDGATKPRPEVGLKSEGS